ncbi:MAG: phosphomannomutase/phosphoglucomutase [Candidatus Peregrinibacteria bacterium]|nr:phosphomannomutase/phosphoglucomutase [Candidatus Peregrinibacteria bacterium]
MTNLNPHIFRAYDIRGIAAPKDTTQQADLTTETAYLIGLGTATYLKEKYQTKNMAVGCDIRLTSEDLKAAFIKGVLECGLDVTDIGASISPMIYWASCAMPFDSATNITASHNPKEYNGIKTVAKNAHSICGEDLQEILKIIQSEKFSKSEKQGTLDKKDIWPLYMKDLLSKAKPKAISHLNKKTRVVIDAGNGVAGKFAPELLRNFDCEVIELYCEPDGNFPNHEANPEEEANMKDLMKAVLGHHADIGIAFDGDGDRVGIVNEQGKMYCADFVLLMLVRDLTERVKNPKVVFDTKFSQAIINKLKDFGAETIMSKTGHSFIEEKIKQEHADIGGETSGHLFFAENYYGFDDAFLAALKILEIVGKHTHPVSQMFNDVPHVVSTPEIKVPCPDDKKFAIVEELVAYFTKSYNCITIDGVRVHFDENSWAAVRASNTSPNLTLRFEAKTLEKVQEMKKIMASALKNHPEISTNW